MFIQEQLLELEEDLCLGKGQVLGDDHELVAAYCIQKHVAPTRHHSVKAQQGLPMGKLSFINDKQTAHADAVAALPPPGLRKTAEPVRSILDCRLY